VAAVAERGRGLRLLGAEASMRHRVALGIENLERVALAADGQERVRARVDLVRHVDDRVFGLGGEASGSNDPDGICGDRAEDEVHAADLVGEHLQRLRHWRTARSEAERLAL
jgi:hypothetical protein